MYDAFRFRVNFQTEIVMENQQKKRIIAALFAVITVVAGLSACSLPPKLSQVDSSATDKPINTPEAAAALKARYEK
jgi:hypothetical protein